MPGWRKSKRKQPLRVIIIILIIIIIININIIINNKSNNSNKKYNRNKNNNSINIINRRILRRMILTNTTRTSDLRRPPSLLSLIQLLRAMKTKWLEFFVSRHIIHKRVQYLTTCLLLESALLAGTARVVSKGRHCFFLARRPTHPALAYPVSTLNLSNQIQSSLAFDCIYIYIYFYFIVNMGKNNLMN